MSALFLNSSNQMPKLAKSFDRYMCVREISESSLRDSTPIVVTTKKTIDSLYKILPRLQEQFNDEILLTIKEIADLDVLQSIFKRVIQITPETDLTFEEIGKVLKSDYPQNFVIGGNVNQDRELITLYRGDLRPIVLPFKYFQGNTKTKPNFKKFKVIDGGLSFQLGEKFEASMYQILYEHDSHFRKMINAQRKRIDKSFGACLFRARTINKINQAGFGLPRETIARIENGKSKKIHASTKSNILDTLKMTESELLTY